MADLKSGAFTGSKEEGNPYQGDLERGIAYDTYEANLFQSSGHFTVQYVKVSINVINFII